MESIENKHVRHSRRVQGRQRCHTSTLYEKNMKKSLTIIYHNIKRLQDDKKGIKRSDSVPHQLKLCGAPESIPRQTENQVTDVCEPSRAHSDFPLQLPQASFGPKSFKRKLRQEQYCECKAIAKTLEVRTPQQQLKPVAVGLEHIKRIKLDKLDKTVYFPGYGRGRSRVSRFRVVRDLDSSTACNGSDCLRVIN